MNSTNRLTWIALFLTVILILGTIPGTVAAQTGVGGSIVVDEGETVSEINAVGGSVVIHGTVTGDVNGAAGNVIITGTVGGDVNIATGNLQISGTVAGDVSAGAGSIHLEENGSVGGDFTVGAGDVRIDGTIDGNAQIGAETIDLGETASIAGSLTYDGNLTGNLDAVGGEITRDRTIGAVTLTDIRPIAPWLFAFYAFIANLLLGAALLAFFPRFSLGVGDQVLSEPIKTGVIGFGIVIAIPFVVVALVLSIIGIPLALVGLLLFVVVAWIGLVYGRFALGMWVVKLLGRNQTGRVEPKWIALVLGLLIGGILAAIPYIGGVVNFLLFILGLGAIAIGLNRRRTRSRTTESPAVTE